MSVPKWSAGGSAQIYFPSSDLKNSIFWNVSSQMVRRRLCSILFSQFWLKEINFLKWQIPIGPPEALPKLSVLTSGILLSGSSVPVWSAGGSAQIYICIPSSDRMKSIFWNVSSHLVCRKLCSNLYLHSQFWQNEINFLKCQFLLGPPEALLRFIF